MAETAGSTAEERDFLLRSIADLDAEYAAGDLSEDDYRMLRDEYVSRAAAALRASGSAPAPDGASAPDGADPPLRRARVAVAAGVVVVALAAGWFVATSSGERVQSQSGSGSVPLASTDRIAQAEQKVAKGDVLGAIKMYDALLADDPENPVALAERGWLLSRVDPSLVDKGLDGIDKAIAADPGYAEAHFYRGMILFQIKSQPAEAAVEFQKAIDANPPPDLKTFLQDAKARAESAASGG